MLHAVAVNKIIYALSYIVHCFELIDNLVYGIDVRRLGPLVPHPTLTRNKIAVVSSHCTVKKINHELNEAD
jgi:hypothetical protein